MRPLLVARLERLLDQKSAKARTVDEEVAFDLLSALQGDGGYETGFGVKRNVIDPAFLAHDAVFLGILAQEACIARGIDMIGVVHRRQVVAIVVLRAREPAEIGGHGFEVEGLDRAFVAALAHGVPDLVEIDPPDIVTVIAEGVDIAFADLAPVAKLDAQLERTLRRRKHLALVDFERLIEFDERRDRCLAHADRTDLLGFDQRDLQVAPLADARKGGGSHPASRTTTDDDDMFDSH